MADRREGQRRVTGQLQKDYLAVMDAIGISVDGTKREVEKAKNIARGLARHLPEKQQPMAVALVDRLNRIVGSLDVPDLTHHRMAKRVNARRSQQETLERKIAVLRARIEQIEKEADRSKFMRIGEMAAALDTVRSMARTTLNGSDET